MMTDKQNRCIVIIVKQKDKERIFLYSMRIEELIKDLDLVTIIEFKNYIIDHLSDFCSTKNFNSKVIFKFKNKKMFCEKCGCKLYKNGKQKVAFKVYL